MIKDKTDLLEEINFNDNEKNKGLVFFEKYLLQRSFESEKIEL